MRSVTIASTNKLVGICLAAFIGITLASPSEGAEGEAPPPNYNEMKCEQMGDLVGIYRDHLRKLALIETRLANRQFHSVQELKDLEEEVLQAENEIGLSVLKWLVTGRHVAELVHAVTEFEAIEQAIDKLKYLKHFSKFAAFAANPYVVIAVVVLHFGIEYYEAVRDARERAEHGEELRAAWGTTTRELGRSLDGVSREVVKLSSAMKAKNCPGSSEVACARCLGGGYCATCVLAGADLDKSKDSIWTTGWNSTHVCDEFAKKDGKLTYEFTRSLGKRCGVRLEQVSRLQKIQDPRLTSEIGNQCARQLCIDCAERVNKQAKKSNLAALSDVLLCQSEFPTPEERAEREKAEHEERVAKMMKDAPEGTLPACVCLARCTGGENHAAESAGPTRLGYLTAWTSYKPEVVSACSGFKIKKKEPVCPPGEEAQEVDCSMRRSDQQMDGARCPDEDKLARSKGTFLMGDSSGDLLRATRILSDCKARGIRAAACWNLNTTLPYDESFGELEDDGDGLHKYGGYRYECFNTDGKTELRLVSFHKALVSRALHTYSHLDNRNPFLNLGPFRGAGIRAPAALPVSVEEPK